jgi:hypothetical protein
MIGLHDHHRAHITRVSRGLLNNSAPSLLQLILRRMWQRPFVLGDLAEIAAIHPATAGGAPDEMLNFALGRIAEALPEIFAALNADHEPASYSCQVSASRAILSHSSAILLQCSFSSAAMHRSACRRQAPA